MRLDDVLAAIKHFEGQQRRYMREHNGTACEYVALALNALYALEDVETVKAELVKFSEAFKGAQTVCEVAISEKKQAIAERDRFKARAEALESEVLARGCITCKHRGTRSLTMPCGRCNMASEWEWRGPQEGANA